MQPGCFGEGVLGVGMDGDEAVGHAEELVNRSCGCDAAAGRLQPREGACINGTGDTSCPRVAGTVVPTIAKMHAASRIKLFFMVLIDCMV